MRLQRTIVTAGSALFGFLLCHSCMAAGCFDGKWKAHGPDFLLELMQEGTRLQGAHLIVAQQGLRIDASEDQNDVTIAGSIHGDMAEIRFSSSFGGSGRAVMVCSRNKVEWRIIDAAGKHWFPDKATLRPLPRRS
jgi:hypothetical protein